MRVPALRTVAGIFLLAPFFAGCTATSPANEAAARAQAQSDRMNQAAVDYVRRIEAEGRAKIADYERRADTWTPQAKEYFACNRKASMVVASQPGDPTSLAIAARSLCSADEAKLRKAIYDAYADDDPSFGLKTMEQVRTRVLENNTGDVVATRLKANSTPAPRPSETPRTDRQL